MPYGHGGEYWGRPVRDGCMQMPNRAQAKGQAQQQALNGRPGVLSWSGARCRHRKQIKNNFLAPFRDSFASCENIETVVIFFPQKKEKEKLCVCV